MVSKTLKAKYSIEKTKRAGNVLFPIFKKEHVSDFANEILREDEGIRNRVMINPDYRTLLEDGIRKIEAGITTLEEVLRVTRE